MKTLFSELVGHQNSSPNSRNLFQNWGGSRAHWSLVKELLDGTCLVFQGMFLLASGTERNTPRNFGIKRLLRDAFSKTEMAFGKGVWRNELHRVPGPCFQARPFLVAEIRKDTPKNFDLKRPIQNAFSKHPRRRTNLAKFTTSQHCTCNDAYIVAYNAVDFCSESATHSDNALRRKGASFCDLHIALGKLLVFWSI